MDFEVLAFQIFYNSKAHGRSSLKSRFLNSLNDPSKNNLNKKIKFKKTKKLNNHYD